MSNPYEAFGLEADGITPLGNPPATIKPIVDTPKPIKTDPPIQEQQTYILEIEAWECKGCKHLVEARKVVSTSSSPPLPTCTLCGKEKHLTDAEAEIGKPAVDHDSYHKAAAAIDVSQQSEIPDPDDKPTEEEKKTLDETDVKAGPEKVNEDELFKYWVSEESAAVANMSHDAIQVRILTHMTNQRMLSNIYQRRQNKARAAEWASRLMYREIFEKLPEAVRAAATFEADIKWEMKKPKSRRKGAKKAGTPRAANKSKQEKAYNSLVGMGLDPVKAAEMSGWKI